LTFEEAKLREPSEKVAARELEVDEDVEGRSGREEGDLGIVVTELVLWVGRWRTSRRWN
jgi:hypothetical protein